MSSWHTFDWIFLQVDGSPIDIEDWLQPRYSIHQTIWRVSNLLNSNWHALMPNIVSLQHSPDIDQVSLLQYSFQVPSPNSVRCRHSVVSDILTGRRFVISRSGRKLLCFNVFLMTLSVFSCNALVISTWFVPFEGVESVIGKRGSDGLSAALDQGCNLVLSDLNFVKREHKCNWDVW